MKHKSIIQIISLSLLLCIMFPTVTYASEIDTSVEGYTEILNMLKVYVRGAGAIVLMIGGAQFFLSLTYERTDSIVRAMQTMGAGCFLMLADNFVQAIGSANGSETFQILFSMVALIISFIGVVLAMLGSYNLFNSLKERNPESRNKSIKLLFGGLMLIALSQSVSSFVF